MTGEVSDMTNDTPGLVVSVGQCGFDNSQIRDLVRSIDPALILHVADDLADTLQVLREQAGHVRLVLVNRILDSDGSSGVDLIRTVKKSSKNGSGVPLMLVSDIESAQASAVAEGAVPGFGKSAIRAAQTRERLRQALKPEA